MLRKIFGGLAGIIAAFAVIMIVQTIGHQVIPPPSGMDPTNPDSIREAMDSLPIGSFLFVLLSYYGGAFTGSFVATWLGGARPLTSTIVVGGLVFAATVANLVMIPHPLWFSVAALVGIPVAAFLGARLAPRRVQA